MNELNFSYSELSSPKCLIFSDGFKVDNIIDLCEVKYVGI